MQQVTITFAPLDNKSYEETLIFAVHRGRPCSLGVQGTGSYNETEEHQAKLYLI